MKVDNTDYSRQRFNSWTVLKYNHHKVVGNQHWICRCDCGKEVSRPINNLKRGTSKSCGCGTRKSLRITHGMSGTPEERSWAGIRQRCLCTTWRFYYQYGGRGIRACEFLLKSPANLKAIVGSCPGKGWSVDRIDTNKHYSCGDCPECLINGWAMNVRWATTKQQARNRRNNRCVMINGKQMTISEIAEVAKISTASAHKRVNSGKSGLDLLLPRRDSCAPKITI